MEQHSTGFGRVIVAKLEEPFYVAFALGAVWPMAVLEVHRLNRDVGSTEIINAPAQLVAADIPGIVEVFRNAQANQKGKTHVDG